MPRHIPHTKLFPSIMQLELLHTEDDDADTNRDDAEQQRR